MSVQSLPSMNAVLELAPRRAAAESERSGESFALPPEPEARSRPEARADERHAASEVAPQQASGSASGGGSKDDATREGGGRPQDQATTASAPDRQPAGEPGSPTRGSDGVKLDAGALVTIAQSQAEEVAAEGSADASEFAAAVEAAVDQLLTGGDEDAETAETKEADASPSAGEAMPTPPADGAAVPTAIATEVSFVSAAIALAGSGEAAAGEAAPGAISGTTMQAAAAVPPGSAGIVLSAALAGDEPVLPGAVASAGDAAPESPAGPNAGTNVSALPSAAQDAAGKAGAAADEPVSAASGEFGVGQTEATAKTTEIAAGRTAETGGAGEASQSTQAGQDTSSLVQQVSAKLEPLRTLPMVEAGSPHQAAGNAQAAQPTPLHVVPIEIGLRALSGARQFDIRLDPLELGRVDVSLSISDDGSVSAKLVVDRVETLHLLQRDARTLERAFEQAGLKPSDSGVDISLRDQSDQSAFRQRQQEEGGRQSRGMPGDSSSDDTILPVEPAPIRRLVRLGGIDMSI